MDQPMFKTENRVLYLETVLVEYEGPVLFICSDLYSTLYLGLFSGQHGEQEIWSFVKISREVIHAVIADRVTLYDVFKHAESGKAIQIFHNLETGIETETELISTDLADDFLPAIGEYLELSDDDLHDIAPWIELIGNPNEFSCITRTELGISVGGNKGRNNIPVLHAGEVLLTFDNFRLANLFVSADPNQRLSDQQSRNSMTVLAGVKEGSFVFIIDSYSPEMPGGKTEESLRLVHRVLELKDDESKIREYFRSVSQATLKKYGAFIKALDKYDSELFLTSTYPLSRDRDETSLKRSEIGRIKTVVDKLDLEEVLVYDLHGQLFGLELIKNLFSFIPDNSEEPISGRIARDTAEKLRLSDESIILKGSGTAFVEEKSKLTLDGQLHKTEFILVNYISDSAE